MVEITKSRPACTTGIAEHLVTRYPTRLAVRCQCGHQGTVSCFLDKPLRLVCSKCGNRDPVVDQRDGMRKLKRGGARAERSYGTAFSG